MDFETVSDSDLDQATGGGIGIDFNGAFASLHVDSAAEQAFVDSLLDPVLAGLGTSTPITAWVSGLVNTFKSGQSFPIS